MSDKSDRVYYGETGKQDYRTPKDLFDLLNKDWRFAMDAAATWQNYQHPCYIAPKPPTNAEFLAWEAQTPGRQLRDMFRVDRPQFPTPAAYDCLVVDWRQVIEDWRAPEDTNSAKEYQRRQRVAVFQNPPYGAKITKPTAKHPEVFPGTGAFVDTAWRQAKVGNMDVVLLLPSKIGAGWFDRVMTDAASVLRVRGRVPFVGAKNVPSFESVIVHFDGVPKHRRHTPYFGTLFGYNAGVSIDPIDEE